MKALKVKLLIFVLVASFAIILFGLTNRYRTYNESIKIMSLSFKMKH